MKQALRWALWSPRNLAIAGAAVGSLVAVVVAVSATAGGENPARPVSVVTDTPTTATTAPAATGAATPSATTTSTAPRATASAPAVQSEHDRQAEDPEKAAAAAQKAARDFLVVWLKGRTVEHDAWVKSMTPLVVPSFVQFIDLTPAEAIPNTTVKAIGKAVPDRDYAIVQASLANGMKLELEVTVWDGKWRVANLSEAR
jgi:hypothetical protein